MRVWLVDLDDADPAGLERAHESGRVGARRLDADPLDAAVAAQPAEQARVAGAGRREGGGAEQPPLQIEHRHVVLVGVRVDAGDDSPSVIRHPFSHRPFAWGRQAGTGGHNSDEALAANRFLSSHDRPDRPPKAARSGALGAIDTSPQRHEPVSLKAGQIASSTPTTIFTV